MQVMNKKAVGEIVVTLALSAIAVAAVVFLATVIYSTLQDSANIQESPVYNCLDLQLDSETALEIRKACYNTETGDIEIDVKKSSLNEFYFDAIKFTLHSNVPESAWTCSDSCSDCELPESGETKTYYFADENPSQLKEAKIYLGECELDRKEIGVC